jgi:hypothetical protein
MLKESTTHVFPEWAMEIIGAPGETRTPNRLIRSQMLYPLSYERNSQETFAHEKKWRTGRDSNPEPSDP